MFTEDVAAWRHPALISAFVVAWMSFTTMAPSPPLPFWLPAIMAAPAMMRSELAAAISSVS